MARMIHPDTISFRATVTEEEIRKRMADEVLEQIGGTGPDGKPLPGIRADVKRGTGRGGGYTIDVSGPMPARIYLPKAGE